ncbi:MAG TPA: efflux transporter outer membrane subunit [Sphingomonas sp.]|uniref:efflux transporter outer membrane subunit n=1 Tax=Sphingomonas sp. TaxID=28214 RepID=UPI002BEEB569|nr:efflux transporter outer membrane subunit [Sphingomonas sp.]HMI20007.1 efflux transporter outer membrane subunit [Sphingomonas sp.]
MNKRTGILAIALLLAGCAAGPDYHAPAPAALNVPTGFAPPITAPPANTVPVQADLSAWWRQFDDVLLTDLIARATAGNLQIAQSVARLAQARESLVQARGDLLPSLTGSAGATRNFTHGGSSSIIVGGGSDGSGGTVITTGGSSGSTQLSLGLDASWQVDIFGGLTRAMQAARADEAAARFDLEGVRTSVAGEVATNYIDARLAQARLEIARSTLKTQDDNLEIAGWRVQAGLASSLDGEQARAQRAQTASTIPALETSYLQAVNRLGILTGQAPGALRTEMETTQPIPRGPDAIAVGIPANTLRRRPDVRSAERQLAAATARIGVAKAALFPALSISGNINTDAASIGKLGDLLTGGLFAGITQTIFDAGRRNSQVRSARAGTDLAFANYRQTVLSGLEDVENAIQSLEAAKARQAQLAVALDASNNAAIYARSQYRSGLIDFLTVLQSEQSLLSARDQLASARADEALALVQLYLALGGGWQPDATIPTGNPA